MVVSLRSRTITQETSANPRQTQLPHHENTIKPIDEGFCGYEQTREKRIKENMERLKQLGIMKLKNEIITPKRPPKRQCQRKTPQPSLFPSSLPPRRSSRLQTVTPVSYSEIREKKVKEQKIEDVGDMVGEGHRPEIYTEEHEKLLGTCEASWTLFEDGYVNGKRVYDSVLGKTCHQCRQKTLGHHTHCSTCNLVQGQFCGDCLYMRYGEHVLEAKQNPNWVCPTCRGICNCSLCRQAKGWRATGALYRKISKLGFKSVAHFLIQTRRSQTKSEEESNVEHPVFAKRSLPFDDIEEASEDSLISYNSQGEDMKHCFEDKSDKLEGEKEEALKLDIELAVGNISKGSEVKGFGDLFVAI